MSSVFTRGLLIRFYTPTPTPTPTPTICPPGLSLPPLKSPSSISSFSLDPNVLSDFAPASSPDGVLCDDLILYKCSLNEYGVEALSELLPPSLIVRSCFVDAPFYSLSVGLFPCSTSKLVAEPVSNFPSTSSIIDSFYSTYDKLSSLLASLCYGLLNCSSISSISLSENFRSRSDCFLRGSRMLLVDIMISASTLVIFS